MFKNSGFYVGSVMFMALTLALPVKAQNAVKMIQVNSQESIFYLIDKPSVTFEGDAIVVEAKDNKVTCELVGGVTFEFVTVDNASVDSFENDIPIFKVNNNFIEAFNLTPISIIIISDLSGKTLLSTKTDAKGHIYIETESFPAGIYIFSSKDKNFKFYKK